jgi:hypothetical protein
MHDELIDRLTAAKPATPEGLLLPDPTLLEEILMTTPATKRRFVTPLRLSAVAAIAAALVAVLVALPTTTNHTPARVASPVLHMQRIVESTTNALSSGRAHVHTSGDTDGPGARISTADFTVEFNGDNRSMYGTIDPGDGRASAFPIANRIVDGQFYLQDGTHWVKDTNNANASGADEFSVDPRNFLAGVADAAQFAPAGTETVGGMQTHHLKATKLDGIPDFNLGLGPKGTEVTAFELWVDDQDVVRSLLVSSASKEKTYPLAQTRITKDANGNIHKSLDPATMGDPVVVTTTLTYKVEFTDIGEPIEITAPAGAVPVAGKG